MYAVYTFIRLYAYTTLTLSHTKYSHARTHTDTHTTITHTHTHHHTHIHTHWRAQRDRLGKKTGYVSNPTVCIQATAVWLCLRQFDLNCRWIYTDYVDYPVRLYAQLISYKRLRCQTRDRRALLSKKNSLCFPAPGESWFCTYVGTMAQCAVCYMYIYIYIVLACMCVNAGRRMCVCVRVCMLPRLSLRQPSVRLYGPTFL